jgi:hypothetical protein
MLKSCLLGAPCPEMRRRDVCCKACGYTGRLRLRVERFAGVIMGELLAGQ